MDNVVDITRLLKEFKDKAEIEAYSLQLYNVLQKTLKDKAELEEKVVHLEGLLLSMPENKVDFVVSTEQSLIESQIRLINQRTFGREMDMDDCKKLEILMRSLKIAKEKNPPIKTVKAAQLPTEEGELIALAATSTEEKNE